MPAELARTRSRLARCSSTKLSRAKSRMSGAAVVRSRHDRTSNKNEVARTKTDDTATFSCFKDSKLLTKLLKDHRLFKALYWASYDSKHWRATKAGQTVKDLRSRPNTRNLYVRPVTRRRADESDDEALSTRETLNRLRDRRHAEERAAIRIEEFGPKAVAPAAPKKTKQLKLPGVETIRAYFLQKYLRFVAAYARAEKPVVYEKVVKNTWRYYMFWLTLNFKKRSLYIGLNTPRRKCIFSYTSGMFLPNYRANIISRDDKHRQLEYLRSLKHKEKKLAKKKSKVARWKCERHKIGTKIYMLRYISRLLKYIKTGRFVIVVRGVPRGLKRFMKELFLGKKRRHAKRRVLDVSYVVFANKFEHTMTLRAIKKRLRKNFEKR